MDAITYAQKIVEYSDLIEELVGELVDAATAKATAKAELARATAITMLKLKNGLIDEYEEMDLGKNLSVKDRELITDGINYRYIFKKEETEALYKALVTKIDARRAQLNGYQSLNKVLQ